MKKICKICGKEKAMLSWEKSDSGLCNDKLTKCENYVDSIKLLNLDKS